MLTRLEYLRQHLLREARQVIDSSYVASLGEGGRNLKAGSLVLAGISLAVLGIAASQIIYTPFYHFIGQLSVVLLAGSLYGLVRNLSPPASALKQKLETPSVILLLSLPMHFLVRLIHVFRYPAMDETNYSINGLMGLYHGQWKNSDSGLVTLWDVPAGLMSFIDPVAGPRLLAALFSVGSIYAVYYYVKELIPYLNSSFKTGPDHDIAIYGINQSREDGNKAAQWLPLAASLLYGFLGSAIHVGSLATHDALGVFLMMSGAVLMLGAFHKTELGAQKYQITLAHILILTGMMSNYALFVFGPFLALLGAFVYWAKHPELSFFEAAKGAIKLHVLPLFVTFLSFFAIFHPQIIAAAKQTYEINEIIWFHVMFPTYILLAEIAMGVGIYLALAVSSFKKMVTENKGLALTLLVGGLSSLWYRLFDGHLQGMVKHYTVTVAALSPLIALGAYQFYEYLKSKKLSLTSRVALFLAPAILLVNSFSQAVAPAMEGGTWEGIAGSAAAWRPEGPGVEKYDPKKNPNYRKAVSPDWYKGFILYLTPFAHWNQAGKGIQGAQTDSIRALGKLNLGKGERLASRERTDAFLADVFPGNVVGMGLDMKPETIIRDPSVVAVILHPEYVEKGWQAAFEAAGFQVISKNTWATSMVHSGRRAIIRAQGRSLGEEKWGQWQARERGE